MGSCFDQNTMDSSKDLQHDYQMTISPMSKEAWVLGVALEESLMTNGVLLPEQALTQMLTGVLVLGRH